MAVGDPAVPSRGEVALSNPPRDGVTAARFSSDSASLLVSSWDSSLRLFDVDRNLLRTQLLQPSPLLDCELLANGRHALSAGLDGIVRLHGLESGGESALGEHHAAVRCVRNCEPLNLAVSGSWDCDVKLWDVRAQQSCIGTYAQPGKVLSICTGSAETSVGTRGIPHLLVATAGRHVVVIDLRKPGEPLQHRESSLKSQTRCIATMPNGLGFAQGSVEGRVAVDFFDPSEKVQQKKFAFVCHHAVANGLDTCYPVNALAFHPTYGTFATGGADGHVYVWDGEKKKRICHFSKYPTSISALAFSPDGARLAVAASYTWENGSQDHPTDQIYVRFLNDADVKPKS